MLKELIAVGMASILLTQPPQNTNDGTYYQDVEITETYEYETNEVNSVDDLVVGNIYKATIDITYITSTGIVAKTNAFYYLPINYGEFIGLKIQNYGFLYYETAVNYLYGFNENYQTIFRATPSSTTLEFYMVYVDSTNISRINYSASDYLGEKTTTIEPVETEGLYNLAYHFLYSRIYTNTQLQGMETTLFGETINLNMWLSHTTAIVIICLLLIVLIKFVIWLFKIVSGAMLWR